jgi:hypothetical protein
VIYAQRVAFAFKEIEAVYIHALNKFEVIMRSILEKRELPHPVEQGRRVSDIPAECMARTKGSVRRGRPRHSAAITAILLTVPIPRIAIADWRELTWHRRP